jgi:hypothetical protein
MSTAALRKDDLLLTGLYRRSAGSQVFADSLGVLRHAQDERSGFEIIDDFPFMLRLSKHSEPFSTACFTFEKRQELQRRPAPFKKEMIRLKAKIEQVLRHR